MLAAELGEEYAKVDRAGYLVVVQQPVGDEVIPVFSLACQVAAVIAIRVISTGWSHLRSPLSNARVPYAIIRSKCLKCLLACLATVPGSLRMPLCSSGTRPICNWASRAAGDCRLRFHAAQLLGG